MKQWGNIKANKEFEKQISSQISKPSESDSHSLKYEYIEAKYARLRPSDLDHSVPSSPSAIRTSSSMNSLASLSTPNSFVPARPIGWKSE